MLVTVFNMPKEACKHSGDVSSRVDLLWDHIPCFQVSKKHLAFALGQGKDIRPGKFEQ